MNSTADTSAPAAGTAAATTSAAAPRQSFRPGRKLIIAIVAIGIAAWLADFAWHAYHYEETDDAYVAGHLHLIGPQVDGQVQEVLVTENQFVKAGDVLVRLDPLESEIAVDKAKADLAESRAKNSGTTATLAEAQARVSQAQAQVTQAAAQLELARISLARNERLFGNIKGDQAITQAELDNARSTFNVTEASDEAAKANLTAAQAALQSAHDQIGAASAAVDAAEAGLRDAQRQLADTILTAPADGRIGNKSVESGNRVKAGQTLLALAEPDIWIVANFKETQLARMHPGQLVEITIDALPGQTLHGRVDSVSPASGAEFALLPPDNATGNFNKVVQRVPVKIVLDDESRAQFGDRLRLGLSAVVNVRVR